MSSGDPPGSLLERLQRWWQGPSSSTLLTPQLSAPPNASKRVRAVGRVAPLYHLEKTTWTHREAVFFRARVESPEPHEAAEDRTGQQEGTYWTWETRLSLSGAQPFWLISDVGRALVLPSPWRGTLPDENVSEHPLVNQLTPAFESLLERAGIRRELFLGVSDKARFHEMLVPVGALISVTGEAVQGTLEGYETYRSDTVVATALRGTEEAPMVLAPA